MVYALIIVRLNFCSFWRFLAIRETIHPLIMMDMHPHYTPAKMALVQWQNMAVCKYKNVKSQDPRKFHSTKIKAYTIYTATTGGPGLVSWVIQPPLAAQGWHPGLYNPHWRPRAGILGCTTPTGGPGLVSWVIQPPLAAQGWYPGLYSHHWQPRAGILGYTATTGSPGLVSWVIQSPLAAQGWYPGLYSHHWRPRAGILGYTVTTGGPGLVSWVIQPPLAAQGWYPGLYSHHWRPRAGILGYTSSAPPIHTYLVEDMLWSRGMNTLRFHGVQTTHSVTNGLLPDTTVAGRGDDRQKSCALHHM